MFTSRNHCNYKNNNIHSSLNFNLINNSNTFQTLNKNNLEIKNHNTPTNIPTKNSHIIQAQNSNAPHPLSFDKQQSINYIPINIPSKNQDSPYDFNNNDNRISNFEISAYIPESNQYNNNNNCNRNNHAPPSLATTNLRKYDTKTRSEAFEVYIAGFMSLTLSDDLKGLCFSILHGISPMLNIGEVANVRLLHNRPVSDTPTKSTDNGNSPARVGFPALIVQLTTSSRVKQLMTLKREKNYYNTRDLDLSQLSRELVILQLSSL